MKRHSQSGVTMVELVIVLAIIALLAAAVYPMLGNVLQSTGSKGASEQVAAAIRLARQYAITRAQLHCIQFVGTPNTGFRVREASTTTTCDSTLVLPPPGSSPNYKEIGHDLAVITPANLSIVFDGVGNVKNFPPGNPTVTLSVDTDPHSCEYQVLVTLYGGVRVTMGSC